MHPFHQPVWSVSRVWQPLTAAASIGTAVLYMSAAASLCKRQPPIILLTVVTNVCQKLVTCLELSVLSLLQSMHNKHSVPVRVESANCGLWAIADMRQLLCMAVATGHGMLVEDFFSMAMR
jgi:hypothetical protein